MRSRAMLGWQHPLAKANPAVSFRRIATWSNHPPLSECDPSTWNRRTEYDNREFRVSAHHLRLN